MLTLPKPFSQQVFSPDVTISGRLKSAGIFHPSKSEDGLEIEITALIGYFDRF